MDLKTKFLFSFREFIKGVGSGKVLTAPRIDFWELSSTQWTPKPSNQPLKRLHHGSRNANPKIAFRRENKCKAQHEYMALPSKAMFFFILICSFPLVTDPGSPSGFSLEGRGQILLLLYPVGTAWGLTQIWVNPFSLNN